MRRRRKSKHKYPISDHCDGTQFFNPDIKNGSPLTHFIHAVKFLASKDKSWPKFVPNQAKPQLVDASLLAREHCHITYINHATHLIQMPQLNILTDPIYAKRAGPTSWLGHKRVRDPGVSFYELPTIHVVLISHNHYDHMNIPTLERLEERFQPLFIAPLGNARYLRKKGISNIIELDWWDAIDLNSDKSITLVPAKHWSMRSLTDTCKSLWGGFWIKDTLMNIYFAGDTGYGDHFKEIKQRLGRPHISILPIGAYAPREYFKDQHMDPIEAVMAKMDLESHLSIATHHRTFRLSHESYHEPASMLKKAMQLHNIENHRFLTPENGETISYRVEEQRQVVEPQIEQREEVKIIENHSIAEKLLTDKEKVANII